MNAVHKYIAHIQQAPKGTWRAHAIGDHLSGTAKQAGNFAAAFGNRDWAELLGFWHDIGKFHPAWQKYLQRESGYDEEAHGEGKKNRASKKAECSYEEQIHRSSKRKR